MEEPRRHGQPWQEWEDEYLKNSLDSSYTAAWRLERTFYAVTERRKGLRRGMTMRCERSCESGS